MIVSEHLLVITLSTWAKPQECAHVVKHGVRLLLLGIPPKLIFSNGKKKVSGQLRQPSSPSMSQASDMDGLVVLRVSHGALKVFDG